MCRKGVSLPHAQSCSPRHTLQIEIGQLDSTIAVSNLPLGNMSYWFEGNSIVITMNLTSGMLSKPLGIFVNKTAPPTSPPAQLNTQVGKLLMHFPCTYAHQV